MFQILSLDGGGIRGIFSAAVLAAIEEDLNVRVVDHFDLIAGTSTGGIIAIGLGLGLSPRQIVDFYLKEGASIFANPFGRASMRRFFRSKFDKGPLIEALQRHFGDKRFGQSTKRLVIPSYNLGEDDVYIFRTAHHPRLRRDFKVPAWKVAQATSAAPTFFPIAQNVDELRLIDGGVWANNPTMVAYIEAVGTLNVPSEAIKVLNLGTCDSINARSSSLNKGGLWQWRKSALEVVLRGQSASAAKHVRFLIGDDNLLRIDPPVPAGFLTLDSFRRSSDLIGKAAHYSRTYMPQIEAMFLNHRAPEFVPEYSHRGEN
jgi:patatin-like phospholipase/acyl hydrolase